MTVDIQQSLRRLVAWTVVIFLLMVMMGAYFVSSNYRLAQQGRRAHLAVCVLRADEIRRVAAAQALIAAHPDGFGGVTVAEIERTIAGEERTISALSVADCPD